MFAWAVGGGADPAAIWRFTLEPDGAGTRLREWMQLGPARSGLNRAIDQMPDKEQQIVYSRLKEFEVSMTATLAAIKERVSA